MSMSAQALSHEDSSPAGLLAAYDAAHDELGSPPQSRVRAALEGAAQRGTPLTHLALRSAGVGSQGAQAVAEVLSRDTNLTQVSLEDNALGDDGAAAIARGLNGHPSVFRLNIGYNEITGRGLRGVAELVAAGGPLLCLDLSGNNFYQNVAVAMVAPAGLFSLAPAGQCTTGLSSHGWA